MHHCFFVDLSIFFEEDLSPQFTPVQAQQYNTNADIGAIDFVNINV